MLAVVEVTAAIRALRLLFTETYTAFPNLNSNLYNAPNLRMVNGGRQLIFFSERSGWGHLYRYDLGTGRLINAVTRGNWLVRDIIATDDARQRLYFRAGGREPGNSYRRHFYSVGYDGGALKLLTPEDGDHSIDGTPIALLTLLCGLPAPSPPVSPDRSVFIDTWSTVTQPAVSVLRCTADGSIIAKLETADTSALAALGWRTPEPFAAKAADGWTDLYGVIYWPDAAAGDKVPLVDAIYAGPQETVMPRNYAKAHSTALATDNRFALSELGFAVLLVDGRATPQRSRDFQGVGYQNFGDITLDDHVAVLKQLAARYPRLDADRIGVYGHSFGGYVSTPAILRHPDVYKVAVSSAGPHRYQAIYAGLAAYLPAPDDGGGDARRPSPTAIPDNYKALDNSLLAGNLTGHLLLAYGDMDENAYPAATLQLIDALVKDNRRYDLLYIPNGVHSFSHQPYFLHRKWDYLVEHLLDVEPSLPPAGPRQQGAAPNARLR